jgi:hypothetical protein
LRRFVPAVAVWCQESEQHYPGDGQWSVMVRRQLTDGLSTLLSAFLQPDDKLTNGACPSDLVVGPFVALVDATGKWVIPAYPRDECGQPKRSIIDTVEHDSWRTVSTTKDHLIASEASIDAGCEPQWKNELSYDSSARPLGRATPVFGHTGAEPRVCLYTTTASDLTVGTFAGTRHLDAATAARLRAALSGSGAGQPRGCQLQRSFAVVQQPGGPWVNVELGGCWRVTRNDLNPGQIGQADPTVTRKILS